MKYLITGCVGFIGFTLCQRLLQHGHDVVGLDNLNHYYDPGLKKARLERLTIYSQFQFLRLDIIEREKVIEVITLGKFDRAIHLAEQAGVRYSLKAPFAYADSNLIGFLSILEGCYYGQIPHLIYASSSSV